MNARVVDTCQSRVQLFEDSCSLSLSLHPSSRSAQAHLVVQSHRSSVLDLLSSQPTVTRATHGGGGGEKKHTPSGSTAHSRIPRTGSPRDTWKDTRVAVACPAGPINGEERLPVRSRADDRDASRRELLRRRRGVFERSRRAQEPKARGVLERRRPRRCS